MAVLLLMMAAVVGMINSVQKIIAESNKGSGAEREAHMVFDRMSADFFSMPVRADIDYLLNRQTGNDSLFFYSAAPAFSAATVADQNAVSLVGYRINPQFQLERLGKGLTWDGAPSDGTTSPAGMVFLTYSSYPLIVSPSPSPAAMPTPIPGSTLSTAFSSVVSSDSTDTNYHVLAADVFRFEFCYLLKPCTNSSGTILPAVYSNYPYDTRAGHTSVNGINGIGMSDVQAVVISLAVLDPTSRQIIPATSTLGAAAAALPDPTDINLTASPPVLPATTWQSLIDNGTFAQNAGLPKAAANQVRIYQQTFPLNAR